MELEEPAANHYRHLGKLSRTVNIWLYVVASLIKDT